MGLAMEWIGGRLTDIYMTVSAKEAADARRLRIARHATAIGNGRDPARYRPDPAARARLRAEFGVPPDRVVVVIVSRLVRHKGHPELLAALRDSAAELWVVGDRLASDHGEDLEPYFAGAGLGAGCAASATARMSPPSSPPPTSSPCPAISRACRCPSSRPC